MEEQLKQIIREIKEKKKGSFLFFLEENHIDRFKEILKKQLFSSKSEQLFDWVEPQDLKVSFVRQALARMSEKRLKNYKVFFLANLALVDKIIQNTLLKSLEEVNIGQIYILASSSEENILSTIRSRCRKIHLRFKKEEIAEKPFFLENKKIEFKIWVDHKPSDLNDLRKILWQWVLYLKKNKKYRIIFPTIFEAYLSTKKINVHLELFWINLYLRLKNKI